METFFVKEGAHSPHTPGLARHRVAIAGDIAIKPGYTVILHRDSKRQRVRYVAVVEITQRLGSSDGVRVQQGG
jgi:hypothetical protein